MAVSAATRKDSIELGDDPRLQRIFWKMERTGWAIMALLLILSVLGVFGQEGILSSATAVSPDGSMHVGYRRFLHRRSPSDVTLTLEVPHGTQSVALWMTTDYVHRIPIRNFYPRPVEERSASGRLLYIFQVDPAEETVVIAAEMNPTGIGSVSAEIGIVGGPALSYSQFIYP